MIQSGGYQEKVARFLGQWESVCIDGRMDDVRLSLVELLNAPLNGTGDGHKVIDAVSCQPVPQPQVVDKQREQETHHTAKALARHVGMIVPQEAGRGQAIAYVQCLGTGNYTVCERTGHAQHQIIVGKVELLECIWVERQKPAMVPVNQRHTIQKGEPQVPVPVARGQGLWPEQGCVDRGLGIHGVHDLKHPFSPPVLV